MPLFGSSNNNNNNTHNTLHRKGNMDARDGYNNSTVPGSGPAGTGEYYDDGMSGGTAYNDGNASARVGGGRHHHPMDAGAPGVGGLHNDPNAPPTAMNNTAGMGTTGRPSKHGATTGKIEKALGSLVGSESLKAKGLQKEQEAHAYKVQSAELSEAERLEAEALARRDRAVALGAHPDHRHLGGVGGTAAGGAGVGNAPGGVSGGPYV
ncbi:unnamed protein product [Mycena citricolor]|uniref:Uncharacterized protein n=1 Tax=Mycena citricolor TaxID=2018698 RepID=A0AAD2HFQ3_9AGAR|nr:unnamed protein product [Mycena citricolor]CAK5274867.1 unnamed protein product [Mycena citricolor]